jgi:hypothetical protein
MISFIFAGSGAPGQQRSHFTKTAGPERARRQNAQATRRLLSIVTKAVNNPALDEDGLTRLEHDVLAVNKPGRGAGQPVNGFVPARVIVGDGHTRVRLDDHLKRIEASSRPSLVWTKRSSMPPSRSVSDVT